MNEQDHERAKNQTLDPNLISKFESLGFKHLTEIQKKAIPSIYQKKDSLIVAPTGSGKTECSVIPILSRIRESKKLDKIKLLYVTPLRSLNRDVFRRITKYAENEGLTIEIRHGDTPQNIRKKISESPPDILITTPETILILLTQKKMLDALSELDWVIIDEVHELMSNERGSQLSISLERLQLNSKFDITRIGLSATIGNVDEAAKFVVGSKRKCKIIQDSSVRNYDISVKYIDGTISDVAQYIIDTVTQLHLDSPVLLFTNTRGESEFLASILREKSDINVELHHGSLSRQVREETEGFLREGKAGIVVCTSSLELGLDIGSIELVIHYGSPRQVSKLIQRIGRSKHNRESTASGIIVTNNFDDEFESKAIIERIKEGSIEEQKIHYGSLDVLAHHIVGLSIQLGNVDVDLALSVIKKAYPFRNITLENFCDVLELLDSNYLIYFDKEKMIFWKKQRAFRYYFENLSTIPDILKFKVFDSVSKKIIGTLDQRFVGDFGDPGNVFVLKGTQWRILIVDEKSFQVNVEPYTTGGVTIPYWEGESIPVDYNTAQKVGLFRTKVQRGETLVLNNLLKKIKISPLPNHNTIVVESSNDRADLVLHSCFGTKINATIATLLSSMLSAILGYQVESRSDAYRIVLSSTTKITKKQLVDVLNDKYDFLPLISASIKGTHNLNWRIWCVSKKFGIVGRAAIYDRKSARFLYERYDNTPIVKESLRELFHDKYDLENSEAILRKIKSKEITIEWCNTNKFSELAEPILDHTTRYYSSPSNIDEGILNLVKTRLFKTRHRLICVRCGKWQMVTKTANVQENLICPYCKSRQITATFYSDYELQKIIQKKFTGKKISKEENHIFERAWKVSSLIQTFGKQALIVLSGYGIGADTAARILRNLIDEDTLYKQIYNAERQYVMTRGFWD